MPTHALLDCGSFKPAVLVELRRFPCKVSLLCIHIVHMVSAQAAHVTCVMSLCRYLHSMCVGGHDYVHTYVDKAVHKQNF